MKKSFSLLPILMASFIGFAHANDDAIYNTLKKMDIKATDTHPSPIAGLTAAITERGVFYISTDGKHLLQGPLYDVSGAQPVNITNQILLKKLEGLQNEMIVYKAPKEKHVITVFTDITCSYCHKLHQQIKEFNELGITVRYLAFPRQGVNSEAGKSMSAIWCMADRKKSLDAAMKGEAISPATCKIDINKHHELGIQFGIQGTPAILLQDGRLIPGYQEPKEMAEMLNASEAVQKNGG